MGEAVQRVSKVIGASVNIQGNVLAKQISTGPRERPHTLEESLPRGHKNKC